MPALASMNTRWWLNIGILVLIAVLVVITLTEPGIKQPPAAVRLTELTAQQITDISISRDDTPIELGKQQGRWMMLAPLKVHANEVSIAALLDIVSAKSHARYAAASVNLKSLQLDPPRAGLVLNKHISILFGGNEPIDYRRYVLTENQVHLVTDRHFHHLAAGVYGFISPALLPPDAGITRIELPDGVTLSRNHGAWQASPAGSTAGKSPSADSLTAFVTGWQLAQSLQVKKFSGDVPKKLVVIHTSQPPQALRFHVLEQAASTWLVRADLGIQYALAPGSAAKLLAIGTQQPHTDTPVVKQ